MKRFLTALLAALVLAGCAGPAPGLPPGWEEDWVRIAEYIGVEPLEGFTLSESNDALSISGLYYAAWTSGEGRDFVNAEGGEATVYDAQIYVLLEECRSAEAAEEATAAWTARERASYQAGESSTEFFGGQEFEVLPLAAGREGNPYTHGAAAFAVRGAWAISVELVCADGFPEEPRPILEQFLAGFHYREE